MVHFDNQEGRKCVNLKMSKEQYRIRKTLDLMKKKQEQKHYREEEVRGIFVSLKSDIFHRCHCYGVCYIMSYYRQLYETQVYQHIEAETK